MTINSVTTATRYSRDDGNNAWADLDGSNNVVGRHLFGDGTDEVVAALAYSGGTATVSWPLAERQGSVIGVMSNTGTLLGARRFDAFGNVVSGSGLGNFDRYAYTGLEVDSGTGYLYAVNRWYDPATQRWLTRDPIEIAGGQANFYQYVANNATNLTDPSGLVGRTWKDHAITAGLLTVSPPLGFLSLVEPPKSEPAPKEDAPRARRPAEMSPMRPEQVAWRKWIDEAKDDDKRLAREAAYVYHLRTGKELEFNWGLYWWGPQEMGYGHGWDLLPILAAGAGSFGARNPMAMARHRRSMARQMTPDQLARLALDPEVQKLLRGDAQYQRLLRDFRGRDFASLEGTGAGGFPAPGAPIPPDERGDRARPVFNNAEVIHRFDPLVFSQARRNTCFPACIQMMMARRGLPMPLEGVEEATLPTGTDFWQGSQVLNRNGVRVTAVYPLDVGALRRLVRPGNEALVAIRPAGGSAGSAISHAVIVEAFETSAGGRTFVRVVDPWQGLRLRVPIEEFSQRFTGHAAITRPVQVTRQGNQVILRPLD